MSIPKKSWISISLLRNTHIPLFSIFLLYYSITSLYMYSSIILIHSIRVLYSRLVFLISLCYILSILPIYSDVSGLLNIIRRCAWPNTIYQCLSRAFLPMFIIIMYIANLKYHADACWLTSNFAYACNYHQNHAWVECIIRTCGLASANLVWVNKEKQTLYGKLRSLPQFTSWQHKHAVKACV